MDKGKEAATCSRDAEDVEERDLEDAEGLLDDELLDDALEPGELAEECTDRNIDSPIINGADPGQPAPPGPPPPTMRVPPALHVNTSLRPEHAGITPHDSGPVAVFSLNSPTDNRPRARRPFLTPTNPPTHPPGMIAISIRLAASCYTYVFRIFNLPTEPLVPISGSH